MDIKVKKLKDNAIIPKYQSSGAAGFDFHATDTISIAPGKTSIIDTGLSFEIPEGYELQIRPRSGLSAKSPLRVANSPGTIDSDYRGSVGIIIYNTSNSAVESYKVNAGDRIAQGVIVPVQRATFVEADNLSNTERGDGAFGSTGS